MVMSSGLTVMAYAITISPYPGRFTADICAGFRICRLSDRVSSYVFMHVSSSAIIRSADTGPLRNNQGTSCSVTGVGLVDVRPLYTGRGFNSPP